MLEHTMCLNCLCRLFMSSSSSTLTTPAFLATSLPAKAVYRISPTSPTDRAVVHPISLPDWVRDDSVLASTHGRCRRDEFDREKCNHHMRIVAYRRFSSAFPSQACGVCDNAQNVSA